MSLIRPETTGDLLELARSYQTPSRRRLSKEERESTLAEMNGLKPRLRELFERINDGTVTAEERQEYGTLSTKYRELSNRLTGKSPT